MLLFVSQAQVIGNDMTGAGAALLAMLVIAGIIHAFLAGLFAALAAALVTVGLLIASAVLRWDAGFKPKSLFQILSTAFMAMTLVTWLLDLALHTYYTVPTTIVAMDYQTCDPNCPAGTFSAPGSSAIIQSVGDYYRVFVAGAPGGWLICVALHSRLDCVRLGAWQRRAGCVSRSHRREHRDAAPRGTFRAERNGASATRQTQALSCRERAQRGRGAGDCVSSVPASAARVFEHDALSSPLNPTN